MFPTLLQIGPVYISSLGFFSFLGFLFGGFVIWRKGKEEGFDEELILDLWIVSLFVGFLTGRLIFCLTNPSFWTKLLLGFFSFAKAPGFSFFGFVLGMLIVWLVFSKKQKWDFWKLADIVIFAFLLFQIFWRLGQFLDGSFVGRETSLPWGLHFPAIEGARHPIQIYEMLFLVLFYWLLSKLERSYRLFRWYQDKRGETKPGFLLLTYFLLYGVLRLLLEIVRDSSLYFKGISWEQLASVVMISGAAASFWVRSGRELKFDFSFLLGRKEKLKPLIPVKQERIRKAKKVKKFKHIKKGLDAKGR